MAFQLDPANDLTENVRQIGALQLDRVLERLTIKSKQGKAVHEARKSMKRLRALLRLVKPALNNGVFNREEARLKQIGRSLSGVRDIHAMFECMQRLEIAEPLAAENPAGAALRAALQEKSLRAETSLAGDTGKDLRKKLRQSRQSFAALDLKSGGTGILARSIRKDYRAARHAFRRAYRIKEDEAFHDWRKLVQRHWRQLLLVEPGWPSTLRPHIHMVRDLADILGDDHDLYVLAGHVRAAGLQLGRKKDIDTYLDLIRKRQDLLRVRARLLGERLLAESPGSLAARLTAYWRTQPEFESVFGEAAL